MHIKAPPARASAAKESTPLHPPRPFAAPGSTRGEAASAAAARGHELGSISIHPPAPLPDASAPIQRVRVFRGGRWVEVADHEATEQEAALGTLSPGDMFDRLGPREKWREHIDGRHQGGNFGHDVYIKGEHRIPRKPDPRYNDAMWAADRYVRSTIGGPFGVKEYHQTHHLAMPNPDDVAQHFRKGELPVRFDEFHSTVPELQAENEEGPVKGVPPLVKAFEPDSEHGGKRGAHVVLADVPKAMDAKPDAAYPHAIQSILDSYEKGRGSQTTQDEMLRHIAHTHKSLENLHPYVDANTRTNRLVLNRMLVENGFPPTILHNPLDVHHHTTDSWVEQIRAGQDAWTQHAQQGGDQSRLWKQHDTMASMITRATNEPFPPPEKTLPDLRTRPPVPRPTPLTTLQSGSGTDDLQARFAGLMSNTNQPPRSPTPTVDDDLNARLARLAGGRQPSSHLTISTTSLPDDTSRITPTDGSGSQTHPSPELDYDDFFSDGDDDDVSYLNFGSTTHPPGVNTNAPTHPTESTDEDDDYAGL